MLAHHPLDWDDKLAKILWTIGIATAAGLAQQIFSALGVDLLKWFRRKHGPDNLSQ